MNSCESIPEVQSSIPGRAHWMWRSFFFSFWSCSKMSILWNCFKELSFSFKWYIMWKLTCFTFLKNVVYLCMLHTNYWSQSFSGKLVVQWSKAFSNCMWCNQEVPGSIPGGSRLMKGVGIFTMGFLVAGSEMFIPWILLRNGLIFILIPGLYMGSRPPGGGTNGMTCAEDLN